MDDQDRFFTSVVVADARADVTTETLMLSSGCSCDSQSFKCSYLSRLTLNWEDGIRIVSI